MTNRYPVGSFILTRSRSRFGRAIRVLQSVIGDDSRYSHAAMVVNGGYVVEALSGGVVLSPLVKYVGRGGNVVVCDAPIRTAIVDAVAAGTIHPWEATDHEDTLRATVAAAARDLLGRRYGWADYLAIGLLHLMTVTDGQPRLFLGWLRSIVARRVADSGRLICSQTVDESYRAAGIHLFTGEYPERSSGDVTPGDLDRYRIAHLEGRPELALAS